MANQADLSDGARQASHLANEHGSTMFGADQAETHMVKLVDGKLVPTADTSSDVSDEQGGFQSDEERALQTYNEKMYERSDAALHAGQVIVPDAVPDNPIAVADITGNPDAGSTVETGLPSEHPSGERPEIEETANPGEPNGNFPDSDKITGSSQGTATQTAGFGSMTGIQADMIPGTNPLPSTPDPNNPVPAAPETPQPPSPPPIGPEIPDLPGSPQPDKPEITDPTEPGRSHEINASVTTGRIGFVTPTSTYFGIEMPGKDIPPSNPPADKDEVEPGEALPGNQYEGMTPGMEDEGMEEEPMTADSAHPYDVNAKDGADFQPGERPEESAEMASQPREAMDESFVKAQDMKSGNVEAPSDVKSTDMLDRHYNDPQAAREMAT